MVSRVSHTTFDCHDAYRLSTWWKDVLGYTDVPDDPNEPGHEECMILGPESETGGAHALLFIEVPDFELPAKRIHLDLEPTDRTREEEVERLVAHGAAVVEDHRGIHGPGTGWVTLADPEGNLFCVLRSRAERRAG